MKTIALLFSLAFIFTACKKNKEYTVKGRVLCSCNTACVDEEFDLYQDYITLTGIGGRLTSFKTDANGFFEVRYKAKNRMKLKLLMGGVIVEDIPVFKNLDIGTVYPEPIAKDYVVKLDVNNQYTSSDTLYYYFGEGPFSSISTYNFKVSGPFSSGELDVIHSNMYNGEVIKYGETSNLKFNYYLNNASNVKSILIPIEPCSTPPVELVIPID